MNNKKILLAFTVLSLIVFGNSLSNDFILDDHLQIVDNPTVKSIQNLPQIFSGGQFYSGGLKDKLSGSFYRPLPLTFFSLIGNIFSFQPIYFRIIQILFHSLNVFLIYLILKKFFSKKLSIFLSLIFLVHPINSETVIYISNLQDILFVHFGLLSLYLIIHKFNFHSIIQKYPQPTLFTTITLSLLSKETGLAFCIIIPLYLYFFQKKNLSFYLKPIIFSTTLYLLLKWQAIGLIPVKHSYIPIARADLLTRIQTIPKIIIHYLHNFIYPNQISIASQWVTHQLSLADFYLPLALLSILIVITVFSLYKLICYKQKLKTYLFFLSWFIIGLSFHIQIIPLDATVADRWFYLPHIGLLGVLGVILSNFKPYRITYAIGLFLIIMLSYRTIIRNTNWKTEFGLLKHDLQIDPHNFFIHNGYGYLLSQQGQYDQAIYHLNKSLQLLPEWSITLNNLGVTYELKGQPEKATQYYLKAIEINQFYLAYENLASLYIKDQQYLPAQKILTPALKKFPYNPKLLYLHAYNQYQLGNIKSSLKAVQRLYQIMPSPEHLQLLNNLKNHQTKNPLPPLPNSSSP